jgi:hypothetical protein
MSWKSFVKLSFSMNYSLSKYFTKKIVQIFCTWEQQKKQVLIKSKGFFGPGNGPKLPYFKEKCFEIAKFRLQVLTCCQIESGSKKNLLSSVSYIAKFG